MMRKTRKKLAYLGCKMMRKRENAKTHIPHKVCKRPKSLLVGHLKLAQLSHDFYFFRWFQFTRRWCFGNGRKNLVNAITIPDVKPKFRNK